MERRILDFVCHLRQAGMKIALSEITDALRGCAVFGIEDRGRFYQILRATLLKNEPDKNLFDRAFRLFFRLEVEKPRFLRREEKPCEGVEDSGGGEGHGQRKAGMGEASATFYSALKGRKRKFLLALMDRQFESLTYEEDLEALLKLVKVRMEWFMVENALELEGPAAEEDREILAEMENYLRQRLERGIAGQRREEGIAALLDDENLRSKDLTALNEAQVREMERRIVRLANHLAAKYSYRLKPAKSGRINMRKLLMEAGKKGYTPEKMFYLDKVKSRPSLVVFCDISGSMAVYSVFFLQLVYAMTRSFRDIRVFLYVDEIQEATADFRENHIQEAVQRAVRRRSCSRQGVSDFGQVLELFNRNYAGVLHRKTTLLILGDAKNNWNHAREEELAYMRGIVQRILWLNPDPRPNWGQEDSDIDVYTPFCHLVMECRNLNQFERAMKQVI